MESPKRSGFTFPFFRRNRTKELTPENAEVDQRKALVHEGHKYLSKATDMVNNRDHQHNFESGHLQLLQDRWAEWVSMLFILVGLILSFDLSRLYGSAPKGKKLTKGLLSPEDFRDKAQILLDDVQVCRVS